MRFVRTAFPDVPAYQEAAAALGGVLKQLGFGETPRYGELDTAYLERRESETVAIVNWMEDSGKADMKSCAVELMGVLGWEAFLPRLERLFTDGVRWEHLAAIRSLARMPQPQAEAFLRRAARDPDAEIRAEAERALTARKGGA